MQMNLEEIYKQHVGSLYRFVRFLVKNDMEAEDIVAETFLKYIQSSEKQTIVNPKAWLFTVARNLVYKEYNLAKFRVSLENEKLEIASEDLGIEQIEMDAESLALIKAEAGKLHPQEREVLALRLFEDMSFAEIAEQIDKKLAATKFIYYQALEKIKVALGERKHSKKLYAFTLPVVAAALVQSAADYQLSTKANLFFRIKSMTENAQTMKPETTIEGGSTPAVVAKASGAKLAIIITAVIAVVTLGALAVVLLVNKDEPAGDDLPVVTGTPIVSVEPTQGEADTTPTTAVNATLTPTVKLTAVSMPEFDMTAYIDSTWSYEYIAGTGQAGNDTTYNFLKNGVKQFAFIAPDGGVYDNYCQGTGQNVVNETVTIADKSETIRKCYMNGSLDTIYSGWSHGTSLQVAYTSEIEFTSEIKTILAGVVYN
jgi:RNA polymerase sigma-70 factor (ECF subfamily)